MDPVYPYLKVVLKPSTSMKDQANQKRYRALIPVANGNEDLEVIAMIDVLRRADIEVVIASVNNEDTVTLMKGSRLVVDAPLLNVVQQEWDLIAIAGGIPGAMNLAESTLLRDRLRQQHQIKGMLGAICLAPALVLKPAGVLDQMKRVTGNPLAIKTPEQNWPADYFTSILGDRFDSNSRVISDEEQQIVLSQTPGTALNMQSQWSKCFAEKSGQVPSAIIF